MPTKLPRIMISIRDPDLGPTIGADLNGLSVSAALRRYADLVERGARELDAVLTRGEWNALADANNGCADLYDYAEGGPATSPLLMAWANVQDTPGLGAKWGIDRPGLVAKLQALALHHGEAILCAVRWFWLNCHAVDHSTDEWWTVAHRVARAKEHTDAGAD